MRAALLDDDECEVVLHANECDSVGGFLSSIY